MLSRLGLGIVWCLAQPLLWGIGVWLLIRWTEGPEDDGPAFANGVIVVAVGYWLRAL